MDRAVPPAPFASINHPARAPRPTAAPAEPAAELPVLRFCGFLRGAAGRFGAEAPREPAPDLVFREPDRLTVLLAMRVSLVAEDPFAPSATRVTSRHPSGNGM